MIFICSTNDFHCQQITFMCSTNDFYVQQITLHSMRKHYAVSELSPVPIIVLSYHQQSYTSCHTKRELILTCKVNCTF